MKTQILVLCVIVAALFSSCSGLRIEKRHYSKGFYVDFNKGTDRDASVEKQTVKTEEKNQHEEPAVAPAPTVDAVAAVAPVTAAPASAQTSKSESSNQSVVEEPVTTTPSDQTVTGDQNSAPRQGETPGAPAPDDTMLVLLVILAILLPPLAVFLAEGVTSRFWITLILCLLGGGFFFSPYIGLLWLVAIIIALLVVLGAM